MTRPKGHPPIVASDDTYSSGDHTGEVTKLDPGAAIVARGWYPGKRRPAKWDNWITNNLARRVDNVDMAEAVNWSPVVDVIATAGSISGTVAATPAFPSAVFHVNADTKIRRSLDGGFSWSDVHADAGATIYDIAASDIGISAVATEGGAAKVITYTAQDNGTDALSSVSDARVIVPDPFVSGVWYVGGVGGGSTPHVSKVDASAGVPVSQTVLAGGGGSTTIEVVCAGRDYVLAARTASGTLNDLRRFARGDATMTSLTKPTSDAITDILWSDEDRYFFLFTETAVYRSPTGNDSSWVNMSAGLPPDTTFMLRGGCVRGSLIVTAVTSDFLSAGTPGLLVSGDAGETWDLLADPTARGGGSGAKHVRNCGNYLAATAYQGANAVILAQSFRAGRPNR